MTIPELSSTTHASRVGFDDTDLNIDVRQLIADVQVRLNEVHPRPTPTPTTGVIDEDTARHLQAFQDAQGLPTTGALDQATIDALNDIPLASIDDPPATLRPGEAALRRGVQRAIAEHPEEPGEALLSLMRSADLMAAGAAMSRTDIARLVLEAGATPAQAESLMEGIEEKLLEHFEGQMRLVVLGELQGLQDELSRLAASPHELVGQMIAEPEAWLARLDVVDGDSADALRERLQIVHSGRNTQHNMQELAALVPAVLDDVREGVGEVQTSVFHSFTEAEALPVTQAFPDAAGRLAIAGLGRREGAAIAAGRDTRSMLGEAVAYRREHPDHSASQERTMLISTLAGAAGPVGAAAGLVVNVGRAVARVIDAQQQIENARLGATMGLTDGRNVERLEEVRDRVVEHAVVETIVEGTFVVAGGMAHAAAHTARAARTAADAARTAAAVNAARTAAAADAARMAGAAQQGRRVAQEALRGVAEGAITGAATVAAETALAGEH